MADYDRFQWGAVQYPLASSTGNTLLEDADPAIFEALGFFAAVLSIHLGDRWDAEIGAIGLKNYAGAPLPIVGMRASYDPVPVFQESQFALPLLALYRTDSVTKQRTVERDHEVSQWGLDWILPPMSPAQLEKLNPFRRAAAVVIADRLDYGYDPNYQSGRQCWDFAGIEYIWVKSTQITWLQVRGPGSQTSAINSTHPILHMDLEVGEQRAMDGDVIGGATTNLFNPLTGIDTTVKQNDPANPPAIDVADTSFTP